MNRIIFLLRVAYWWGIIADAFETVRMCLPKLFLASGGLKLTPGPELGFGLLYGMPVMLGWTILLFWADRKPLERSGVLLCVLPVIGGYIFINIHSIISGVTEFTSVIPFLLISTAYMALCLTAYMKSRRERLKASA